MRQIKCHKCNKIKNIDSFSKRTKSKRGYSYFCKDCHNKYVRETWYLNNRTKQIKSSVKWKRNNKFKVLASKYSLKETEVKEMFDKSMNKCLICTLERKLVLDHSHKTKKIRGFICSKCNKLLGFANDDITILKNAIKYLDSNCG